MKNERLEAIRSGLYQYVGALMREVGHEGQETMHLTLAQLSEVWLTCCYDTKKKAYNLFIAKPLLRAVQVLLQDRQKQIMMALPSEVPKSLKEKLDELNTSIKVLDTLVVTTKEEEETP